ncbi:MAG: winged helix-turn-helix domain-containing protein [Novosphingobium sp.]|uniref:winged helix-turn-helix domain-containing protein n=1 Tax=Novosphingobium sp. TaxID=1874826 RepID=UPI00391BED59|nr:helix-turn-helix domain-containing protein [Novosphingobium sp.]
MRQFQWFAAGPVPDGCDLRRLGWTLVEPGIEPPQAEAPPLIAMPHRAVVSDWVMLVGASPKRRQRVLAVGVEDPGERARLLRLGFGDAIGGALDLEEIESRALRIDATMRSLPRERSLGPLKLDLLLRDAFAAGRGAGLHPREFLLLWQLADEPGMPVPPSELLSDVWRLAFRSETNSLAVHVSRLRAKLRTAGLDGLVETQPDGAYRLAEEMLRPALSLAHDYLGPNGGLDAHLRLSEEAATTNRQDKEQCAS